MSNTVTSDNQIPAESTTVAGSLEAKRKYQLIAAKTPRAGQAGVGFVL